MKKVIIQVLVQSDKDSDFRINPLTTAKAASNGNQMSNIKTTSKVSVACARDKPSTLDTAHKHDYFCCSMIFWTFSTSATKSFFAECVFLKSTKKETNNISQFTYNGSNHQMMFRRMLGSKKYSKEYVKNLNNTGERVHF